MNAGLSPSGELGSSLGSESYKVSETDAQTPSGWRPRLSLRLRLISVQLQQRHQLRDAGARRGPICADHGEQQQQRSRFDGCIHLLFVSAAMRRHLRTHQEDVHQVSLGWPQMTFYDLNPPPAAAVAALHWGCITPPCVTRSQRCPQHTDEQRRAVRVFLLGPSA